MALSKQIVSFCKKFAHDMPEGNVAVFAGAGLSASAGFVDWRALLAPFALDLDLDIDREGDNLVRFAQYSQNHKGGHRAHLNEALITAFPTMKEPAQNHQILARLPISTYWTTNYDRLLETALSNARKIADVKHTDSQLPHTKPRRDAILYKMHGDVDHPQEAVLTRDDYESYSLKRPGFVNALVGDLTGKTFLFLGFSFTDPNLENILSQLRQRFQTGQREHYCLLKRPKRSEFKAQKDFLYAQVRQRHFVVDLKRYNVTALEIDTYSEVTEALFAIERFYRRRSVFISGSAADYSPWTETSVNSFFRELGAILVDHDFRLISGFGLGVGNSLITGAIERAYLKGTSRLDHFLEVRPFPRDIADHTQRAILWDAYRHELLSLAGIALFFFGNKIEGGASVLADGVRKEFDIARKQGVATLPVGATGFMAAQLSAEILRAPNGRSKVILDSVSGLSKPVAGVDQLLQPILTAVKAISSE
jgi:hypothetical protein